MIKKVFLLLTLSILLGIMGLYEKFSPNQALIFLIFLLSILGTLFFWDFRLCLVFIGTGLLFLISGVHISQLIKFASLDVIIFLIGMMIVVAVLKESDVFQWLAALLLRNKQLTGRRLFVTIMFLSAALSGLTGEATSIIVMMAIILEVSETLKIKPTPLVISSVLTTNIGSASTLLGNPIGILIALRGSLTFEDFLIFALPVSVLILLITILILCLMYKGYLNEISSKISAELKAASLTKHISLDNKKLINIVIFGVLILSLGLHRRLEILLGLAENGLLVVLPIIFAAVALIFRCEKVEYCIAHEVEWRSLLFFMFLFIEAGILQASGVADLLAEKAVNNLGNNQRTLTAAVLFSSGVLSAVLDNTVVVASYIPVVKNLHVFSSTSDTLWWSLLFGACFGGNITAIGSTANIIALGLLEKEKNIKVNFLEWLKVGFVIAVISMAVAYFALTLPHFQT